VRTLPSFPVAARDFVMSRYDEWHEKTGGYVTFSFEHPDFPKFPKVVRGHTYISAASLVENEAGTETSWTFASKKKSRLWC
jgi:hypothetical protein